jgi:hypothetical protein
MFDFPSSPTLGQTYSAHGVDWVYNGYLWKFGEPAPPDTSVGLDLDFTLGTLDPKVTFTRTTTATYVNSAGLIAAAAIDAPRFDYNPVTLAPKGLLVEEQRTNLLLNSLISGANLATQSVTVTAAAHVLSFYGTGTVTLSGASAGSLVGSGAYPTRSTLTFTPAAGSLTLTVTGTVQFAQLEVGDRVTSFIPTAAAAVTRAVDFPVITGTNFSSWWNQATGTIFFEGDSYNVNAGARLYQFDNGAGGSRILNMTNYVIRLYYVTDAGTAMFAVTDGSLGDNVPFKTAFAFAASDNAAVLDGDTVSTAPNTIPAGIARAQLMNGENNPASGHVRRLTFYNVRKTNAEIQAMTA